MESTFEIGSDSFTRRPSSAPLGQLTPRQIEVLALLYQGLPNKLIGRQLNISLATVKIHVSSILRALNVSSRLQAVIAARRLGLSGESATVRSAQRDRTLPPGRPVVSSIVCHGISSRLLAAAADQLLPEAVG